MWLVSGEIMPALRGSLSRVVSVALAEIRQIAAKEDGGGYLLEHVEVTADFIMSRTMIELRIQFFDMVMWFKRFPVSEAQLMEMDTDEIKEKVTHAMRGTLDLLANMHHARLARMFPNCIHKVEVEFSIDTRTKLISVMFKNGHIATASEAEAKTDLFTARCAMLYDLPPK